MLNSEDFHKGARAYRNGFLIGAFAGIVICLLIGRTIWTLPIVLGLLFGAIAINSKLK